MMAEYRRSAHAVFEIKYHIVWITKYRFKVLKGRVAKRTRDSIRQLSEARDVIIVRGALSPAVPRTHGGIRADGLGASEAGAVYQV